MGDLKPSEDIAQRLNRVRVAWPVNRSLSSHEQDQALYAIIAYLDERHEATAGLPQAPADGGDDCEHGFAADDCPRCDFSHEAVALREQVAALTAEQDGLGQQLMAEIEAKLFNINEVVKWTGLATEHRKELHATRAELRKRDAVVEAAKALRLAQNNWALEEALYTALDALEALTQPAASDVLLVPAKDPARNPALIDSFWRDPGGTED